MGKSKSYKVILIDSNKKDFSIVEINKKESLDTLQKLVGGYITPGHYLSNGDLVFVDEEGNMKNNDNNYFYIEGSHQPFIGNGVVVSGDEYEDVVSQLADIKNKVRFYTQAEIRLLASKAKGA